jgi:putative membrane protein
MIGQSTSLYPSKRYGKFLRNLDLGLAVAHHLLIFAIFGLLLLEFLTLRAVLSKEAVLRIAKADLWFGIIAALILIIGFSRAVFAAKGWAYDSHNLYFWAKLGTFALIGILSIKPTLSFIRWRRAAELPDAVAVKSMQRYLHAELALFVFLPIFAAAMARGYGQF